VVTGNTHKATEVAEFFRGTADIIHVSLDLPEYRSDDVGAIARGKAEFAFRQLGSPLIVDDTGLFIDALNGFPGPYAAFVLNSIGNAGILKLMAGITDRHARFVTAIAFSDHQGVHVFQGTIEGRIATIPRGTGGFGYDPIFETGGKTLAEIPLEEKSRVSHRARALAAFHDWFVQEYQPAHDTNG
jgi:XTP/dITP diphosphohydrolase